MKKKFISLMSILLLCGCGNIGNNSSSESGSSSELSNSFVSESSSELSNSSESLESSDSDYSKDIDDYYRRILFFN